MSDLEKYLAILSIEKIHLNMRSSEYLVYVPVPGRTKPTTRESKLKTRDARMVKRFLETVRLTGWGQRRDAHQHGCSARHRCSAECSRQGRMTAVCAVWAVGAKIFWGRGHTTKAKPNNPERNSGLVE